MEPIEYKTVVPLTLSCEQTDLNPHPSVPQQERIRALLIEFCQKANYTLLDVTVSPEGFALTVIRNSWTMLVRNLMPALKTTVISTLQREDETFRPVFPFWKSGFKITKRADLAVTSAIDPFS